MVYKNYNLLVIEIIARGIIMIVPVIGVGAGGMKVEVGCTGGVSTGEKKRRKTRRDMTNNACIYSGISNPYGITEF